jgi:hypothetical protein
MAEVVIDAPSNGAGVSFEVNWRACFPPLLTVIAAATSAVTAPSATTQTRRDVFVLFHDLALATACHD